MTTESTLQKMRDFGTTSDYETHEIFKTPRPSQTVFYTDSTSPPKSSSTQEDFIQVEDDILSETAATVLRIDRDLVQVKLDPDLVVHFPIELFEDKSTLLVGQQLKYQITREDGYRQQAFIKDSRTVNESDKDDFLNLLDQVEIRQDNNQC